MQYQNFLIFVVAIDFKPIEEEAVAYWCSLEKLFWNFPRLCSNTPIQWSFFKKKKERKKKEGVLSTILSKRRHRNWCFSVGFAKHTSRQLFWCLKRRIDRLEMLIIPNILKLSFAQLNIGKPLSVLTLRKQHSMPLQFWVLL